MTNNQDPIEVALDEAVGTLAILEDKLRDGMDQGLSAAEVTFLVDEIEQLYENDMIQQKYDEIMLEIGHHSSDKDAPPEHNDAPESPEVAVLAYKGKYQVDAGEDAVLAQLGVKS